MKIFSKVLLLTVFVLWLVAACGAAPTACIRQYRLPVLAGKADNPVLAIELIPCTGLPFTLRKITLSLCAERGFEEIESVRICRSAEQDAFTPVGRWGSDLRPDSTMRFTGELRCLGDEPVYLWVCLNMKSHIDLRNRFWVTCTGIGTDEGDAAIEIVSSTVLRPGVVVRERGDDGVHTCRIPGLVATNRGTLLAVYDVRYESSRDLQGHIDIGLSRSVDLGTTWEPMRIVMDRGRWGGLPQRYNGISDANILVDRTTGDILVTALWMHGVLDQEGKWIEGLDEGSEQWVHQWHGRGSQPGYDVKQTSQVLQVRSTDDGVTWSEPVNVTRMGKRRDWWLWAPSPGSGITLADGTLVMPSQGRDASGKGFSNIAWSDDHGRTWHSSEPAYSGTSESTVVQLADGSLMLNMRLGANRGAKKRNGRVICVTSDLGRTWVEHPASRCALIEPECMGHLYKHSYDGGRKSLLLFSNPDSKIRRVRHGIKASFDDGATWPEANRIVLDEFRSAGYSCMTGVDERTVGILYESSRAQLVFQLVGLDELITPEP